MPSKRHLYILKNGIFHFTKKGKRKKMKKRKRQRTVVVVMKQSREYDVSFGFLANNNHVTCLAFGWTVEIKNEEKEECSGK